MGDTIPAADSNCRNERQKDIRIKESTQRVMEEPDKIHPALQGGENHGKLDQVSLPQTGQYMANVQEVTRKAHAHTS